MSQMHAGMCIYACMVMWSLATASWHAGHRTHKNASSIKIFTYALTIGDDWFFL